MTITFMQHTFFRVWSDPIRNRLYTINMNNDEVYYINLNEYI